MAETNHEKFRKLLGELFMFDQADLDFGIYKIMNTRRKEIAAFLDNDLLPQVRAELAKLQTAEQVQLQQQIDEKTKAAASLKVNPDTVEDIVDLKKQLAAKGADVSKLESEVFDHLTDFFRRYYDEGDFISKRRYTAGGYREKYAIPYDGEEVVLHWANKDQYYVKSGEYLRDYAFRLPKPDGRRVHFRLVDADTETNNNKPVAGNERRFMPVDGDEFAPEENGELVLSFEYRVVNGAAGGGDEEVAADDEAAAAKPTRKKKVSQDELNKGTVDRVATLPAAFKPWVDALKMFARPEGDRTVLQHHLRQYTARNTFDYFIHKDLAGFLCRELDFYVKSEVMHLDDVEGQSAARVNQYLAKIAAIRKIARKVIDFLAHLEGFQKKLWLKKKFVVETNWCVTLDRVSPELLKEVAANASQRAEWVTLFAIDRIKADKLGVAAYSEPLTPKFLEQNRHLTIDTRFFDEGFKERLVAGLGELADSTDGLLIHGDNFHGLNLLLASYRGKVRCTYIDPPYNTGDDGFPYKDSYQSSSWLSMLQDRLLLGRELSSPEGTITVSIDDAELDNLSRLLHASYGASSELAKLVWDRNRKNDATFFSVGHEYMLVHARDRQRLSDAGVQFREPKEGLDDAKEIWAKIRKEHGESWDAVKSAWMKWFETIQVSDPRRRLMRYSRVGSKGPYRDDGNISWPGGSGPRYEILHPTTKRPCKVPSRGWVYPTPERFWEEYENGRIAFGTDEKTSPRILSYLFDSDGQVMPSVFYSYAQTVSQEFDAMWGRRVFDNAKNWRDLVRIFRYLSGEKDWVVDYFAGSGTTAHAVINLNREGGHRRYICVDMGDYFFTVTLPRIRKAIYSREWQGGMPVDREGVSHAFKYIRLEGYEDVLNNLQLDRLPASEALLGNRPDLREDYTLRYMLDVESRGSPSLLDVKRFRDPFNYSMDVATGTAGETRPVAVDLVETFNYLIGLAVSSQSIRITRAGDFEKDGEGKLKLRKGETRPAKPSEAGWVFKTVEGRDPTDEKVLVIWRTLSGDAEKDNAILEWFVSRQQFSTKAKDYGVIYVNGDNNLENVPRNEGENWKVRLIEEEFHRLMFEVKDV